MDTTLPQVSMYAPENGRHRMSVMDRLRFLRAYLGLVKNTERTEEVFNMAAIGLKPRNRAMLRPMVEWCYSHAEFREMYQQMYLPKLPDIDALLQLPKGTVGHEFAAHMKRNNLKPDFYPSMAIEEPSHYVAMRLRQSHDLWHVLTGYGTDVPGELALQGFTYAQSHAELAATILSAGLLHVVSQRPSDMLRTFEGIVDGYQRGKNAKFLPAIRFEEMWEMPIDEARRLAGI